MKKITCRFTLFAIVALLFASCSSSNKEEKDLPLPAPEKPLAERLEGSWMIESFIGASKVNNKAIKDAIEKEINEGIILTPGMEIQEDEEFINLKTFVFDHTTLSFNKEKNFEIQLSLDHIAMFEEPNPKPILVKGKFEEEKGDILAFTEFNEIDLGAVKELLVSLGEMGLIPGFTPEMLDNLPELVNGLLFAEPLPMQVLEVKEGNTFSLSLDITKFFSTEDKIASIIEKAEITGVEAKDVKVEEVKVTVTCNAKK